MRRKNLAQKAGSAKTDTEWILCIIFSNKNKKRRKPNYFFKHFCFPFNAIRNKILINRGRRCNIVDCKYFELYSFTDLEELRIFLQNFVLIYFELIAKNFTQGKGYNFFLNNRIYLRWVEIALYFNSQIQIIKFLSFNEN